jgi:hypothetical protein
MQHTASRLVIQQRGDERYRAAATQAWAGLTISASDFLKDLPPTPGILQPLGLFCLLQNATQMDQSHLVFTCKAFAD